VQIAAAVSTIAPAAKTLTFLGTPSTPWDRAPQVTAQVLANCCGNRDCQL
jgi:hypothetical protein